MKMTKTKMTKNDEKTMKTSENDKNENDEKTMKTSENDKNGINLLKIIITQLGMK